MATRTANDGFVEWGGGYYYPDLFGSQRANRWGLLAREARRTWEMMKKCDMRLIGFNFSRYDSPEAMKAYQVYADEMDGLLAILAFQYAPYEAGAGKTFWVRNRRGIEIPVVTTRYAIWCNFNEHPRAGTPAKIAREIRESVTSTPPSDLPRYDWVIDHVWSYFRRAPGRDENAENILKQTAPFPPDTYRGYPPAVWCAERLPQAIRVVSLEELLWRIRMKHNPVETRKAISQFPD